MWLTFLLGSQVRADWGSPREQRLTGCIHARRHRGCLPCLGKLQLCGMWSQLCMRPRSCCLHSIVCWVHAACSHRLVSQAVGVRVGIVRTTRRVSLSCGKPVCTGFRYSTCPCSAQVGVNIYTLLHQLAFSGGCRTLDLAAAAVRPAQTRVLPTSVLAPQTRYAGTSRDRLTPAAPDLRSASAATHSQRKPETCRTARL